MPETRSYLALFFPLVQNETAFATISSKWPKSVCFLNVSLIRTQPAQTRESGNAYVLILPWASAKFVHLQTRHCCGLVARARSNQRNHTAAARPLLPRIYHDWRRRRQHQQLQQQARVLFSLTASAAIIFNILLSAVAADFPHNAWKSLWEGEGALALH